MSDIIKLSAWKTKQLQKAMKICSKDAFANFPNMKTQKIVMRTIEKFPPLIAALNMCTADYKELFYTMHWILGLYDGDSSFSEVYRTSGHFIPLSIAFFANALSYSVSAWKYFRDKDINSLSRGSFIMKQELNRYLQEPNYALPMLFKEI